MVSALIAVSTSYAKRSTDIVGMRINEENQTSEWQEMPGRTLLKAADTI
jgi:hypothetical protein